MSSDNQTIRAKNIFLTGRPGVGKTTVVKRLADSLGPMTLAGFYTAEIRAGGQRQGFQAVTFSGQETVLAHANIKSGQRVGRYGVDVAAFEKIVLPEMGRRADLMLIDEIGKMECFSCGFISAIRRLLDGPTSVLATVAAAGGGFIAEAKARPDVEILQVTRENRDELPNRVAGIFTAWGGSHT